MKNYSILIGWVQCSSSVAPVRKVYNTGAKIETLVQITHHNRPYSYSRYWTGTSLQWRLMRGNIIVFEKTPPHQPHLQASSSPMPGIRIWPILNHDLLKDNGKLWKSFSQMRKKWLQERSSTTSSARIFGRINLHLWVFQKVLSCKFQIELETVWLSILIQLASLIRQSIKFTTTIPTKFQSQALIHFLLILPTLHSQISHSVLEWSNSSNLRPSLSEARNTCHLCKKLRNLLRFSSFHWKCTVQQCDWSDHLTAACRGSSRSFGHGKVDPI